MKLNKMAAVLVGVAMISGLAACGTSAEKKETAASVSSEAPEEKALSGDLTVYTSQPEEDIQALIEVFNQKYPEITVNVFRSGTEEVVSKLLAEKQTNSVLADVLLVADAATFETLKKEDLLMSYQSSELEGIGSDYYDSDYMYTGTKIISTGIISNTDMASEPIISFKNLIEESVKDNVIMPSPLYSGAAAYNLGVLTRTDLGWEFYESLKDNGTEVVKGNGAVQTAVVAGEKACGVIVDYMALRAKADGAHVAFVYPQEGSLCVTEPIGIIKGTKKEELAKAFVDFILSEEGQQTTSEIGYTPIKSGVAAPDGFKTVDEIENLTYDINTLVETREADKEKFAELFQSQE